MKNLSNCLPRLLISSSKARTRTARNQCQINIQRHFSKSNNLLIRQSFINGSGGGDGDSKSPWKSIDTHINSSTATSNSTNEKSTDVLIVGGGVIGWSTAFWLRNHSDLRVTVVERDPTYTRAATVLSVGGIRQQFSEAENIQMSMFGVQFLRNIRQYLSVIDEDPPDIHFTSHGYLILSSESGADQLNQNFQLQKSLGAKVELLSKKKIKERWPWMNVEDVACGTYGYEDEGWFDPWSLLFAFRNKALSLGANFMQGEVIGFQNKRCLDETTQLTAVNIRGIDSIVRSVELQHCVNAAGPWAGDVARMAGVGLGGDGGVIHLPVEPRQRYVYVINCRDAFKGEKPFPLLCDYGGVYVRPDSQPGQYLAGLSPTEAKDEPVERDLEVDYAWFQDRVWPGLAHRVPSMEGVKIRSAWAGFYDFNYADHNLIIGNHPGIKNFYLCNGSSGHGIQHSIAIGRALMEKIVHGNYKSIDLSRLAFDRFCKNMLVKEKNIV